MDWINNGWGYDDKWFNEKTITIKPLDSTLDDDSGFYTINENNSFDVSCDVQPLDSKVDIDETGKLIDAEYKVYCDRNSAINENCNIVFDSVTYSITKMTRWDDYFILYIKAVK